MTADGPVDRPEGPERLRDRLTSLRMLDVEVATRAGLAVAIPLVVLALAGRQDLGLYASFGAFTALYGRSEVYRTRLRTSGVAGLLLLAAVTAGTLFAASGSPVAPVGIGLVVLLVAGTIVTRALSLHPPAPIFFTFAFLACAYVPIEWGDVGSALLTALLSAVLAFGITMSGWLVRRVAGDARFLKPLPRVAETHPDAWRDPAVWLVIAQLVVGGHLAALIGTAAGLGHAYWATVAVVAVIPPPHAAHSISRALHRMIGTFVGVGVTALILWPDPPVAALIAVVAVCQFLAEILVGRHYGAALVAITPLALLMVHIGGPSTPVSELLLDRALETAIGAAVGIVLVLLARAWQARRTAS